MAADDGGEDEDAPLGPPPDPSLRSWRHPSEIASANAAAARDQATSTAQRSWPARRSLTFVGGCALGVLGVFVLGAALVRPLAGPNETETAADETSPATASDDTSGATANGWTPPTAAPSTGATDSAAEDQTSGDAENPSTDESPSATTIAHLATPSTLPATLEPGASGVVALLDPSSQAIVATGMVIDGHVLSSSGALDNRTRVLIATPDGPLEGTVEGADPFSDLAVISVLDPDQLPMPVRTSASDTIADRAGTGDNVWLVASGGQPTPIAISGQLSAIGEDAMATNGEMLFGTLHTTIRVPRHGIGGALLDSDGRTIGMIVSCDRQLAVALPIETLQSSAASIRETGWGHAGWLGLKGSLDEDGIVLYEVVPGGPAALAGLEVGDRLQAVGGQPLEHMSQLVHAVRTAGVGNELDVVVVRGDQSFIASIVVGTRVG